MNSSCKLQLGPVRIVVSTKTFVTLVVSKSAEFQLAQQEPLTVFGSYIAREIHFAIERCNLAHTQSRVQKSRNSWEFQQTSPVLRSHWYRKPLTSKNMLVATKWCTAWNENEWLLKLPIRPLTVRVSLRVPHESSRFHVGTVDVKVLRSTAEF